MREIKTIESERYEKMDDGVHLKYIGMVKAQEAFDTLKKHLEKEGMLPDEYFSLNFQVEGKELPDFCTAVCHTDWGGSEGIYIDIDLIYFENNEQKTFHFATGKTLESSGDAFLKMSRIAAECSMMLNGRGSILRVSEKNYENSIHKSSLEERLADIKERQNTNIPNSKKEIDTDISI